MDTLGEPDILVNIAGVKGEQDWEAVYDVNLVSGEPHQPTRHCDSVPGLQKGVHHGLETGTRHMSREAGGRGGVIVNVSSTCGVTCQGDMYATPAYTASKHAVTALTRTAGVRPGPS